MLGIPVYPIANESTALQLGSSDAARHRVEAPGMSWQITDCPEISVDWISVPDAGISVNRSFSQERCRSRGWSCVLPCFAGSFRGLRMWTPRRLFLALFGWPPGRNRPGAVQCRGDHCPRKGLRGQIRELQNRQAMLQAIQTLHDSIDNQ